MGYIGVKEVAAKLGWSYQRTRKNILRDKNGVRTDGLVIIVKGAIVCKPEVLERLK